MKQNKWADPSYGLSPVDLQFMRKGQVGDWKNYFDGEKNEKWHKWIADNIKGTGLEELDHFKNLL